MLWDRVLIKTALCLLFNMADKAAVWHERKKKETSHDFKECKVNSFTLLEYLHVFFLLV